MDIKAFAAFIVEHPDFPKPIHLSKTPTKKKPVPVYRKMEVYAWLALHRE